AGGKLMGHEGRSRDRRGRFDGSVTATLAELFWPRVDRSGGAESCWPWKGIVDKSGYGVYSNARRRFRTQKAHRVAWMLHYGRSLSSSEHVLHRCDNPPCCNPGHLRQGTHADNMADMKAKGRANRKSH